MAATENRTLQIVAKVIDFASGTFSKIGRSIAAFASRGASLIGGLLKSVFSLRTAFAGLAGAFLTIQGGKSFAGILDGAENMIALSRATGVTIERLSELQAAVQFSGVGPEKLTAGLKAMQKAVSQVVTGDSGGARAADAFGDLGISLAELSSLSPDQLLFRISDGLERVGSESQRAALLQRVFGDSYFELVPLLGQGSAALRQNIEAARLYGATIGGSTADAAKRFSDSMIGLDIVLKSIARDAMAQFVAKIQPGIDSIVRFLATNKDFVGQFSALLESLTKLGLKSLAALVDAIDFFLHHFDLFIGRLARIPIIGDLLKETFGVKEVTDEVLELSKKADQLADSVLAFRSISARGSENVFAQEAEAAKELERTLTRIGELTGASKTPDEALGSARLRQLSGRFRDWANNITGLSGQPLPALTQTVPGDNAIGFDEEADERRLRFLDGYRERLQKIKEEWTNWSAAGNQAAGVIDHGLDGVVSALTETQIGLEGSSQAWKRWKDDILKYLVQVINRMWVMYAVQQLTGLFSAGGSTSTGAASGAVAGASIGSGSGGSVLGSGAASGALGGAGAGIGRLTGGPAMSRLGGGSNITVINIHATDAQSFAKMLQREESAAAMSRALQGRVAYDQPLRQALTRGVA